MKPYIKISHVAGTCRKGRHLPKAAARWAKKAARRDNRVACEAIVG